MWFSDSVVRSSESVRVRRADAFTVREPSESRGVHLDEMFNLWIFQRQRWMELCRQSESEKWALVRVGMSASLRSQRSNWEQTTDESGDLLMGTLSCIHTNTVKCNSCRDVFLDFYLSQVPSTSLFTVRMSLSEKTQSLS